VELNREASKGKKLALAAKQLLQKDFHSRVQTSPRMIVQTLFSLIFLIKRNLKFELRREKRKFLQVFKNCNNPGF